MEWWGDGRRDAAMCAHSRTFVSFKIQFELYPLEMRMFRHPEGCVPKGASSDGERSPCSDGVARRRYLFPMTNLIVSCGKYGRGGLVKGCPTPWRVKNYLMPDWERVVIGCQQVARAGSRFPLFCGLAVPETIHRVIVHHARGLHHRVANRRADKLETALEQILAHLI